MAKKKTSTGNHVLEGIAAVAAVAAAAGAVFLYATDSGKKKRKEIKSWMLKAKGEVLEKIEKAKDVNQEAYENIVDAVAKKYSKLKTVGEEEVVPFVKELKGHWSSIKKEIGASAKKAPAKKKSAKKTTAKKAPAKKTAKKSSK